LSKNIAELDYSMPDYELDDFDAEFQKLTVVSKAPLGQLPLSGTTDRPRKAGSLEDAA
jgi:hypothetical protein